MNLCSEYSFSLFGDFKSIFMSDEIAYYGYQNEVIRSMYDVHTTHVPFLQDTQQWVQRVGKINHKYNQYDFETIIKIERTNSRAWEIAKLDMNSVAMQCEGLYTLLSPVYYCLVPMLIILARPSSSSILHYICPSFINSLNPLHTSVINIIAYILTVGLSVYKAFKYLNTIRMHERRVNQLKQCITQTIYTMKKTRSELRGLITYRPFNKVLKQKLKELKSLHCQLKMYDYSPMSMGSITAIYNVLSRNKDLLLYADSFNTYIHCMQNLATKVTDGRMNAATFLKSGHISFKQVYHPRGIRDLNIQPCDTQINHTALTGIANSGKTTISSAILFNLRLSQQVGYGCFKHAEFVPYDWFHINTTVNFKTDTWNCRETVRQIQLHSNDRHFCMLDSVFRNNRPHEIGGLVNEQVNKPVVIASFFTWFAKQTNIDFVITTDIEHPLMKDKLNSDELRWNQITADFQITDGICSPLPDHCKSATIDYLELSQCPNDIMQLAHSF